MVVHTSFYDLYIRNSKFLCALLTINRLFRELQKAKELEYKIQLDRMKEKLEERPFLFERQVRAL